MEINNESSNKRRLGRGLGSLLGENTQPSHDYPQTIQKKPNTTFAVTEAIPVSNETKVWQIAIDKMVPGLYQPRRNFNKESIEELANSIKENGILQPIVVRKRSAGGFEIIAGERRWRAAQVAGLHEVPALIKTIQDKEALQLAIIENVQREDLDPIEEAEGYQRLIEEFSYSQQEVAEKVGKERSSVANALRLLALPKTLKELLIEKKINVGHAKVLLSVTDPALQSRLGIMTVEKNLSVRALETELKKSTKTKEATDSNGLNIDLAAKLAQELSEQIQKALGTKVQIDYKSGKGQVHIHFYSDDQLTAIYDKLKS